MSRIHFLHEQIRLKNHLQKTWYNHHNPVSVVSPALLSVNGSTRIGCKFDQPVLLNLVYFRLINQIVTEKVNHSSFSCSYLIKCWRPNAWALGRTDRHRQTDRQREAVWSQAARTSALWNTTLNCLSSSGQSFEILTTEESLCSDTSCCSLEKFLFWSLCFSQL